MTIARFTFRSLTSHDPTTGNQVDDISFEISYPAHLRAQRWKRNRSEQAVIGARRRFESHAPRPSRI